MIDIYIPNDELTFNEPLKGHIGALSFATVTWTSPNHKVYMAVTVHFENEGMPAAMLLDIVELVCLHSGLNLAAAFAKILEDFGIDNKVSNLSCGEDVMNSLDMCRSSQLPVTMPQTMIQ